MDASDEAKRLWEEFEAERDALVKRKGQNGLNAADVRSLDELHARYRKAEDESERAKEAFLDYAEARASGKGFRATDGTSIGQRFLKNLGVTENDRKALDGTTGGSAVRSFWIEGVDEERFRNLFVQALVPRVPVDSGLVQYVQQTVATRNAAAVAPHGLKPTSIYTVERKEADVKVIAAVSEALDRSLLSDSDALTDFIDHQLRIDVLLSLENQMINGDGTGTNMSGILNTTGLGSVVRDATGSEPHADAIMRAVTTCRGAFYEPSAVVLNPTDWETIRLAKDGNNNYQAGNIHAADDLALWGIPVVASPVIALGTGLVGDFTGAKLYDREAARVTFSETGASDAAGEDMFMQNELRFRGELRAAFAVLRPAAFAKVDLTGV